MNAGIAGHAGTPQLKQFHMVNTRKEFPRGINSDQAISDEASTEATSVRPGPGLKLPGPRPISNANKGLIHKHQAPSRKRLGVASNKLK